MGPWGEPELLVWRPEAVGSEPPGPVGLEVKMGALVLLLLLTALCSLVPICVLRRPGAGREASASRQKALSLVSCFAGGVFLATCLLDLLPDYLAAIDEALAALHVTQTLGSVRIRFWLLQLGEGRLRACCWHLPAPVPPARVHLGNGFLPGPGDGADHTGLQGAVRATASRGDQGSAGNGKRGARAPAGRGSPSSPLSPARLRAGLLPGPALGVRGPGGGAAARPGPGHGAVPRVAAPQGCSGGQLVPAAAAESPAGAGGGRLWGPLLVHDPSGHRAGGGSGRVGWAAAPAGPVCAGGHGGWHLPLHHLPGNLAPGAGHFGAEDPQGHLAPCRLCPPHWPALYPGLEDSRGPGPSFPSPAHEDRGREGRMKDQRVFGRRGWSL